MVHTTEYMTLHDFSERQLAEWPEAAQRYRDLDNIRTTETYIGGMPVRIQYNPSRAVSTLARTDTASVASRPCFLCSGNRPRVQESIPFTGHGGHMYEILVNPFPIFPEHFTVPSKEHIPQHIEDRFADMLMLADSFPEYIVFYNGPECGASAPDHLHFQMGSKGFLPVEKNFSLLNAHRVLTAGSAAIRVTGSYIPGLPVIEAPDTGSSVAAMRRILKSFKGNPSSLEPMLNIICWKHQDGEGTMFRTIVIPRKAHRPSCYFATEKERIRISPASADIGGVFTVPMEDDFLRTDAATIEKAIHETVDTSWQPVIDIGLLESEEIAATFSGEFSVTPYPCRTDSAEHTISGRQIFSTGNGEIHWNGNDYSRLAFRHASGCSHGFTLHKVKIGIDFHWEREEDQVFSGDLTIIPDQEGKHLIAINSLPVEDYLISVISSEMNGDAPEEFLKAHAVISRSWLLARPTLGGGTGSMHAGQSAARNETDRIIRWYDREDHTLFDVCADDHCQRYQGLLRSGNPNIRKAVEATRGQVLTYGDTVCDARFSKCCGGMTEIFSACWADEDYPYLRAVRDNSSGKCISGIPDLENEDTARRWILSSPEAFCNTDDRKLLSTVLNSYDQETSDFFRWKTEYTQAELRELLLRRSGIDFGDIISLTPVKRGKSGRITELRITGTLRTVTVGKELEIRRWLSESHLYSSAFTIDTEGVSEKGIPARFILHGAGWGHGVGLCQTGAAAMSAKGYSYKEILSHYFTGSELTILY